MDTEKPDTAVWVLTDGGLEISRRIGEKYPEFDLFLSEKVDKKIGGAFAFKSLKECVRENFKSYRAHIFIMSTGITVRVISDLIDSKLKDPAVLVIDDRGLNVISLLSGHIGGANSLCRDISEILRANCVITTATDVNNLPAIDTIATENDLVIENPSIIKKVNSLVLKEKKLKVYDPLGLITPFLRDIDVTEEENSPDVAVTHRIIDFKTNPLILRPKVLYAGIGCNRGTDSSDIKDLLFQTLENNKYSHKSLKSLATIDIKKDEDGILKLAKEIFLPIKYYNKNELNSVEPISEPSKMALKHVGVKSVCEAAAMMASKGKIVIPKNKTKDVTIAIAMSSIS